ncbi:complement resistance protein TraT [Shewanella sp. KT0246]|uniref:complement resistance protein TraT n=1 Tax=Shewanella sp. KT0246 TaxID=2815912 RepID=UPI001BBFCD27|nr:complement resistance protein TraT [Shewanella sp. KT0246]GIU51487.1 hypothetical protein TUM4249_16610 [Shewanella sp. KT0246]
MISGEHFSFTISELELLFRVQYSILEIENNTGQSSSRFRNLLRSKESTELFEKQNFLLKKQWLDEWSSATSKLLNIQLRDTDLHSDIQKCFSEWNDAKITAFLVEAVTFTPYTAVGDKEKDKCFSDIKYSEEKLSLNFAKTLSISVEEVDKISNIYGKTIKAIYKATTTNHTLLILSAAAAVSLLMAPYLAAGIGGLMGLSGAAATSAGLAMLGGGSLATAGFGMAGGYVATMGGGMLLSYGANKATINKELENINSNELVISSSKLAAFLEHYKTMLKLSQRDELMLSTCSSLRDLQSIFESDADKAFISGDNKNGKIIEEKVQKLAAFRRIIRS